MDKQQLHDFTTTEAQEVLNEEPEELTPDEVEELTPEEVEEALIELKERYNKYNKQFIENIFNNLWEIRYTRKWYRQQKHALKHHPSFTYVDLDALMILCFVLVITDILALTTKLLGWW